MISYTLLSIPLLLSAYVLADLTCESYPLQSDSGSSTTGVINFTGQGALSYIPSTNATAPPSTAVLLSPDSTDASTFTFQLCQSTSLSVGLEEYQPPLSSPGPDCPATFFNPVYVVDSATGNCLTRRPSAANPGHSEVFLQACNYDPTTKAQFFLALQTLTYVDCGDEVEYGPIGFYPWGFDQNNQFKNPESPWVIGGDGETVVFNPIKQKPVADSLVGVVLGVD